MHSSFIDSLRSRIVRASGALAICGGVALAGGVASAQTFSGLGFFADGTESYARDVSQDGSVVVGYGFIPPGPGVGTGYRGFSWTGGVMTDLGTLGSQAAEMYSNARGVSAGGSVIAGWSGSPNGTRAFLWAAGVMTDLGTLPNYSYSQGYGISDNGSVVVGVNGTNSDYTRAFRRTGAGMQDLGALAGYATSLAYGVSGDGSVVVGQCTKKVGQPDTRIAFRWAGGHMTSLGKLKNGAYSEAWAASGNGSVVVGTSDSASGVRAFRWTGGTMTNLGTLPGYPYSYGRAVSADGSRAVGYGSNGSTQVVPVSGSVVNTGHAFLWTSTLGMVDLNTYLPTLGIDLSGWELREARGISADGNTIVGWGWHNGQPEAWVAHVP
ncbi:MAG: PEP-CTERM sorting domain-containing protein [Phycisphaerales bacterium]|nr:PEP-CTERM sorting domain-containing protein [Phycisphaerales bacterium]